jgi:PAS domain S-box-containing protein
MSDATNKDRPETFLNSVNPEDLHRFLFEEAADGMFITDPQSRLLAVNPRGTELIGYALEELVGMTITDLIPPDELARDPVRMDELRQGRIVLKERQFRRKDGSLLPVEISARMLPGGHLLGHVRDITKRKGTERALRDREQRLRLLTDNMVDAISQVDAERSVVYCSPSVERVFGIKQADLIGRNAYERVHPEDAEGVRQQAMGAIASQAAWIRAEYRYLHGRGEYVWVESSIRLLFAENGDFTGAVIASRDITERKHAEERLRERENLLSSIFRAAPTGIGMVSNRRLLAVNDRICEMIGCSREELIGKSARVFYPGDADFEYVGTEKYRQIAERGTGTVETRWQCKDGRTIDVLLSSTPINALDTDGGVTFTALDITERKRSEDALRQANLVVENSPVVVFRWRAAAGWPVVMVSQNVIQFGYTPEELLSGTVPFAAMVHPEDLDRVGREVQEYTAGGTARFQQEYRIVTKDGRVRYVDDRTVVERNAAGQIAFYQGIVIDITERKQAEEALRASLEEKESLLKEVHHRVKNNLQVVSSLLNLQTRQVKNPEVRSFLQDTQNRVRSMAMLHEILYRSDNFAKIGFPQYAKSVCAHAARSYGSDARNVRLKQEIADVALNPDQAITAGLIINELVANAFKHAFPSRSDGEILVELQAAGERHLVLRVSDNGVGFPAERSPQSAETLGLLLVSNLSRQLDGQLSVTSEQGAVFQIVFPAHSI